MSRARWLGAALIVLLISACAAGPNVAVDVAPPEGDIAGLWQGWWHGVIVPVTFFVSLFSDNVSIYEVHNSGGWYDFGFLFGMSMFWGGGAAGSRKRRR